MGNRDQELKCYCLELEAAFSGCGSHYCCPSAIFGFCLLDMWYNYTCPLEAGYGIMSCFWSISVFRNDVYSFMVKASSVWFATIFPSSVVSVSALGGGKSVSLGLRANFKVTYVWHVEQLVNLHCFKALRFWNYYQVTILTTESPLQ